MQNNVVKKSRARDLGIPFEGSPGPQNAITDVQGVEVGHTTLISGEGKLIVGKGPVRTGVTAIFPCGKKKAECVFAGWFSLNGNGEMTGTTWVEESGFLEGPIMLTNTHSVGIVRDSVIEWQVKQGSMSQLWSLPVVAETYDGFLNDINGFHITKRHVFEAIENASSGPVVEGSVGGGTGMICFDFKGGIGTASRKVHLHGGKYLVGVLVQANFGSRKQLRITGVPVGVEIPDDVIRSKGTGSIIIIVATDAPLLPHQLKRLARRASLGLARTGSIAQNGSGDIFIAFSTANHRVMKQSGIAQVAMLPNDQMNSLFDATVQATEEAIINAMIAAETMIGRDNHKIIAIPHDRLKKVLKKYGRLIETTGQ
ncbi:MAG: P1 family peptidase [Candidatus Hodarchaeota archaeon]